MNCRSRNRILPVMERPQSSATSTCALVIQARMGSSRLPGKVLRRLGDRTVLEVLICRLLPLWMRPIVVATSEASADDPIEREAKRLGVEVVRGPEHDVLRRYAMVAHEYPTDYMARLTADSPLLDPATIKMVVERLMSSGVDYVSTAINGGYPLGLGVEAFRTSALLRADKEAALPWDREHVTTYIKRPDAGFTIAGVPKAVPDDDARLRFTIDTEQDLETVSNVYALAKARNEDFTIADIVSILNHDIRQMSFRSAQQTVSLSGNQTAALGQPTVFFRVNADAVVGMGHLERCILIAAELRSSCHVVFLVSGDEAAARRLRELQFETRFLDASSVLVPDGWYATNSAGPKCLILDIPYNGDTKYASLVSQCLLSSKKAGLLTVLIDGAGSNSLAASTEFPGDIIIRPYPEKTASWPISSEVLEGLDYVPIDRSSRRQRQPLKPVENILITFGGADPARLTEFTIETLQKYPQPQASIDVVVGPAFGDQRASQIRGMSASLGVDVAVHIAPSGLGALLAKADIGIGAMGLTKYEMAMAGLPAILLPFSPEHEKQNKSFGSLGTAICLSYERVYDSKLLHAAIDRLCRDSAYRDSLSRAGLMLIDGMGAGRIASGILRRLGCGHGASV